MYGGEPPAFEVATFMKLFDANDDGRISYDEFNSALGVAESSASSAAALLEGAAESPQAEVIGPAARAHRAIASHPARRASRGTSHAVHVAPRMPSTWHLACRPRGRCPAR